MKATIVFLLILITSFSLQSQNIEIKYFDKFSNQLSDSAGACMKSVISSISKKEFAVDNFTNTNNSWIKTPERYIITRKKNNIYDRLKFINDRPVMRTQIQIIDTLPFGFRFKEYNEGFCFRQAEAKSIFPLILNGECIYFGKTKKDQPVTKYYYNNLAYEPIVSDLLNTEKIATLINNPQGVDGPQYPGGIRQFRLDVLDNMEIPLDQFDLLDSTWTVMFTINENGNLNNPSLITGITPEVNTGISNAIEMLTNPWIPANDGTSEVSFTYVLPITFKDNELAEAKFKKEHPGEDSFVNAMFRGGQTSLRKTIASLINYPDDALRNGIEGRVIVSFIVDTSGNIKNPHILRSSHLSLNEEALRVVQKLNGWIPAKQYGKPVSSYYTVPIRFALRKDIARSKFH